MFIHQQPFFCEHPYCPQLNRTRQNLFFHPHLCQQKGQFCQQSAVTVCPSGCFQPSSSVPGRTGAAFNAVIDKINIKQNWISTNL